MELYLAPLQGLTDWIFRESFYEHIGQFDKCFAPFIRVQDGDFFRPSQCNDIKPENNTLQRPIPQFLGNDAVSFARFEALCHQHGYSEANINLGCPFAKVAHHRLGSGLLPHSADIQTMLEQIFSITKLNLSIKCRLGQEDVSEFDALIPIFNSFPLVEIIIHARTGKQLYKGDLHYEAFAAAATQLKHPVCYNGDILSLNDIDKLTTLVPSINRIMIGRGVLANPFLLAEIRKETLTHREKIDKLRNLHVSIIERCKQKYSGDTSVLRRFEEMWTFHADGFEDGRKIFKQVKKCKTLAQYESMVLNAINTM